MLCDLLKSSCGGQVVLLQEYGGGEITKAYCCVDLLDSYHKTRSAELPLMQS